MNKKWAETLNNKKLITDFVDIIIFRDKAHFHQEGLSIGTITEFGAQKFTHGYLEKR